MKLFLPLLLVPLLLWSREPISPIPQSVSYNAKKAALGKELFFETALSKDHSVACITCHNIYDGGADKRIVSTGYAGRKGNIQSPTVLNAVFNFRQFWNGRAKDLYEQAKGPLQNPVEHNMTPQMIVQRISANPHYLQAFKSLYKKGVSYKNVIDAIVEFEKTLVTPNSKFDLFLQGKSKLTPKEKRGYTLFKRYGCISCHNGINIGGNSFAKIGIFFSYPYKKEYPDRYALTRDPFDKNVFKVPTLRNIALTAPYFHDGSRKTLKEAIQAMAHYNLGQEMPKEDVASIASFLKTLTGKLPKDLHAR